MSMTAIVSAVSDEIHYKDRKNPPSFESYRELLIRSLRLLVRDCRVVVQEELIQGPADLLATLDHEVQHSTVVIHLVGDMAGAFPTPLEFRKHRQRLRVIRLPQRGPDEVCQANQLTSLFSLSRDTRLTYETSLSPCCSTSRA